MTHYKYASGTPYLARYKLQLNVMYGSEPPFVLIVLVKLFFSVMDKSLTLA